MILSLILFLVFAVLGSFHFYWLFGGKWGGEYVIPTIEDSPEATFAPPKLATLVVALGLTSFAIFYLVKSEIITFDTPDWVVTYGSWFIPITFTLRAIGEFKYLGFFKKMKNTKFAKADSKIFSPLCLFIGVVGFLVALLT